jgi:hypothetical protein
MKIRKDFELKLGKPIYAFTLYQKIKRVTISLENNEYPILMASFDLETDYDNIITNKILPLINELGLQIELLLLLLLSIMTIRFDIMTSLIF